MARIKIDKDGLRNNISAMQNHITQLDNYNRSLSDLIKDIHGSWEGDSKKTDYGSADGKGSGNIQKLYGCCKKSFRRKGQKRRPTYF